MAQIVDFSTARPDLALVARTYVGVARYLAPLPNRKVVTPSEVTDILAHGLALVLVWEGGSSRAGAGRSAGVSDATEANRQADILGAPADLPIFYAVDYDAAPGAVEAYFRGAASGKRPVAVYGSFRVVEWLLATGLSVKGWQTAAWSHGQRSQRACLYQRVDGGRIPGTDVNDVLHPDWGQWARSARPPSAPPEEDMPAPTKLTLVRVDGDPTVHLVGFAGAGIEPIAIDNFGALDTVLAQLGADAFVHVDAAQASDSSDSHGNTRKVWVVAPSDAALFGL